MQIIIVENRLPAIAAAFEPKVNDLIDTAILQVKEIADGLVPRDTGALAANTTIEYANGGNGSITWNQDYAAYQELGTSRMGAQPYAQPAVDQVAPTLTAALAGLVDG